MKKIFYIMVAVLLCGVATARAGVANMEALLIRASNDPAALNYKLDAVVPKLRKVFKFQSYDLIGEGNGSVNVPGSGTIDLGKGHSLEISLKGDKGDNYKAEIRWLQNGKVLFSTGAKMSRKEPLVLGGPKDGNGTLIITVTPK